MFNILISERRLIQREIRNKGNITREFDTGYLVVVSKQVKSSRKVGISHKLLFKTKGPYIFMGLYAILYGLLPKLFCKYLKIG